MDHLHCQQCGAHFMNRAELDHHNRRLHGPLAHSGQRGELAPDAAGGVQERPAGSDKVDTTIATPKRAGRQFSRSPKE